MCTVEALSTNQRSIVVLRDRRSRFCVAEHSCQLQFRILFRLVTHLVHINGLLNLVNQDTSILPFTRKGLIHSYLIKRSCIKIIDFYIQPPNQMLYTDNVIRAISELHKIEISIFSLWKQIPDLPIGKNQINSTAPPQNQDQLHILQL